MRNLIITFILAIIGISAKAQDYYPLPSTQIYGDLVVDSSFVNEFQGYVLSNDSLDLGFIKIPHVGMYKPLGSGYFLNGMADWSGVGGEADEIQIGYISPVNFNRIKIDTSNTQIASVGHISLTSNDNISINGDSVVLLQSDIDISMFADTIRAIAGSFALINSTNFIQFSARDETYGSGWDYGYTAFGPDNPGVSKANCTMYAYREDIDLDVNVIYVDSIKIEATSRYGVVSNSEFLYNEIEIDSSKILLAYGIDQGGINPTDSTSILLNQNGVEILGRFNVLNNVDGTGTQVNMDTTVMNITYSERANAMDYQGQLVLNAPQSHISHSAQGIIDAAEGKIEFDGDTTTAYITLTADSVIAVGKFVARGDTIILDAPVLKLSAATPANGRLLTSDAVGVATWQSIANADFSAVESYIDNTAAEAALGPGKIYYTDVAGEYILKVTH